MMSKATPTTNDTSMMNEEGTYRAQVMPTIVPIQMLIGIFPSLMILRLTDMMMDSFLLAFST